MAKSTSKSEANQKAAGAKRRPPSGGKQQKPKAPRTRLSAAEEKLARFQACKGEILERLARGESLLAICETPGMPPESTVRKWVVEDYEGFGAEYASARDLGLDAVADQILRISDESNADVVITEDGDIRVQGEVVQRSKLRVDSRKWYLSKIAPKKYGERLQVDQTVNIQHESMDDAELMAAFIERVCSVLKVDRERFLAFIEAERARG